MYPHLSGKRDENYHHFHPNHPPPTPEKKLLISPGEYMNPVPEYEGLLTTAL